MIVCSGLCYSKHQQYKIIQHNWNNEWKKRKNLHHFLSIIDFSICIMHTSQPPLCRCAFSLHTSRKSEWTVFSFLFVVFCLFIYHVIIRCLSRSAAGIQFSTNFQPTRFMQRGIKLSSSPCDLRCALYAIYVCMHYALSKVYMMCKRKQKKKKQKLAIKKFFSASSHF